MSRHNATAGVLRRGVLVAAAFAVIATALSAADTPKQTAERDLADRILETAKVQGGLVAHIGCGDGRLTAALLANDSFVIHGLDTNADNVARARQHLRELGLYGKVSVDLLGGDRLPYADNLVNLVVVRGPSPVGRDELLRVLSPGGVAVTVAADGQLLPAGQLVKPWPDDIDEWTHWLHGADGNAVADDRRVGPPRHVQWIAEPRWQRHHEATPSVAAMVSSGGRLFAIINEAAAGIDGLPDRWALVARDAFNGKRLWTRPIPEWGWSQWGDHSYGNGRWNLPTHIPRRLVAVGDRVYVTLGFNAPLTALNAATGRTVMTYPQSEFTDEILYHEGTLVLVINETAQGPGRIGTKPPVKKAVVALDAPTGKRLWKTSGFTGVASKADAIERATHLSIVLGGGKVFLTEEDAVVALDMQTGQRLWRKERAPQKKVVTYGQYYFGNLFSLIYHDGVVLFVEPDSTIKKQAWNAPAESNLLGISAETGKVLWTRKCGMWGHYNPGDVFVIGDLAWVHDGQAFTMLGLDPKTGEVQRMLSTEEALNQGHHHRCYRNKATVRYILTARRGVEFIDLESEQNLRHHWVRGTCRYGVMPCNGLLYVPPHPCICYITSKLNGFWALAPKRNEIGIRKSEVGSEREVGRRSSEVGNEDTRAAPTQLPHSELRIPTSPDWPTYRHDAARSGCASTEVSSALTVAWERSIGDRPSSPVIAAGKVVVAVPDTHAVWALAATDGSPLWSYTAGGRVDTPPTVHRGLALFGSADGWVTCLRLDDGQLVWRRRAAPRESRIMNRGQLESPWPVHGSVLIQDDVAYFAAGRSSFLDGGIYVYAVDPETGDLLHETRVFSPDPETGDMAECRLPYDMPPDALGALPDVFVGDGKRVYMRHLEFETNGLTYRRAAETAKAKRGVYPDVGNHLMSVAGLLDDSWFNQTYWTIDGKSHSKLLVFDTNGAYGVKPFGASARHSRSIFRPGTDGYTLFAADRPQHRARWSVKTPIRTVAMVVAGQTVFVAGSPDIVDPDDPWSALDGRQGGLLWAVSAADGKRLSEHKLASPPVFDGMAAAQGRLYLSTADGNVICFDGR